MYFVVPNICIKRWKIRKKFWDALFRGQRYYDADQKTRDMADEKCKLFRNHIWGEQGICDALKKLKNEDYGKDLELALFQFYVNPLPMELQHLKEIESFRKKEKAIGIPIIINDENFFSKSDGARYHFLKQSILEKLDLLAEVVKKRKLDTNMELLKADTSKVLDTDVKR